MAKFKSGSHLINTPTVGNDLSADGQALSILFGGVQVGVGSDSIKDTNLVATQVVTVEVPVEGITAKVGVIYDVRGSVDCEGSSKATLLMSTGVSRPRSTFPSWTEAAPIRITIV